MSPLIVYVNGLPWLPTYPIEIEVAPPDFLPYSNLYPNTPTKRLGETKSEFDKERSLLPLIALADVQLPDAIEPALIKSFALDVVQAKDPNKPLLYGNSNFKVKDLK